MKIESVYVENFGKLHEFRYDFTEGINVIKENNGWGKSTLAAFIRAMFYGFEGDGRQKVTDNERKRFKPWQGGAFGGNLVFETKGKRYRIERSFGTKALEDVFKLYDADKNVESSDFTEKIGQELFHINSASFMNTVFVSQNDSASSTATDDINTRIGNINDTIDLNKFEAADTVLKDALNKLSTTKTGKRGKLKAAISDIKADINAGLNVERSLDETMSRIDERELELLDLRKREKELNIEKAKAGKAAAALELKKRHDDLIKDIEAKKADLDEAKSYFTGEIPGKERLKELRDAVDDMSNSRAVIESNSMSEADRYAYIELSNTFRNGLPDPEELGVMLDKAKHISNLRLKNEKLSLNEDEEARFSEYERFFRNEGNPSETAKKLSLDWGYKPEHERKAENLREKAESINDELSGLKKKNAVTTIVFVLLAAISLIVTLLSVLPAVLNKPGNSPDGPAAIFSSGTFGNFYLITAFLFVLFVALTIVGKVSLAQKAGPLVKRKEDLLRSAEEEQVTADAIKDVVIEYLVAHDFFTTNEEVGGKLWELNRKAVDYESLLSKRKNMSILENEQDILAFDNELKDYLARFSMLHTNADAVIELNDLKNKAERYRNLKRNDDEQRRAEATFTRLKGDVYEQLRAFDFEPLMNLKGQIEDISQHLDAYLVKEDIYKDAIGKREKFESENDVSELASYDAGLLLTPDELNEKTEALNAKIDELTGLINTDKSTLNALKERYDQLLDDRQMLADYEEELKKAEEDADLYTKTKQFLNDARDNLTMRYIGPLKDGFDKYYELIGNDFADYSLDVNLVLSKSEQGASRDKDLLSMGYRDLCGFCLRLSMADAMYKGEKPMLIFDDPFVNLDDEKIVGARKLLDEIRKNYQVIYLTCREDRI